MRMSHQRVILSSLKWIAAPGTGRQAGVIDPHRFEQFTHDRRLFSTTSGTGFDVTYVHPDDPFRHGAEISIALEASDLTEPPNSTLFICCFNTEESEAPAFSGFDPLQCETFVDNRTNLFFEVYGASEGVDVSTLEVRIDNKLRKVFVRPRILRDDE